VARGAINLPIITEYNPKGLERAISDFKKLQTRGEKAAFAFRKSFAPAVGALGGLVAAMGPAIGKASDLEEATSKVQQIFGDAAAEIQDFARTADIELGQSQIAVFEAAGVFGTFGKAAGLAGEDLATFTTDFVTLAGDLASFNNTSPEEAVEAIGAALRGESEPLRRYGVLLDDARLRAEALRIGIYDGVGALDAEQKILAAQSEIYKQTSDAQGDFARTSEGLANQSRILKARFENITAEVGQALLPVMERLMPFVEGFVDFLANNTDLVVAFAAAVGATATAVIAVNAALKVYQAYKTVVKVANTVMETGFRNLAVQIGKAAFQIGLVSGAAFAALEIYKQYNERKQRTTDVTNALVDALLAERDGQYGAVDAAIAATLASERNQSALENLGISAQDYADFLDGEAVPALDRFNDVAGDELKILEELGYELDFNTTKNMAEFVYTAYDARDAQQRANAEFDAGVAINKELADAVDESTRTQEAMAEATAAVEAAMMAYEDSLKATADQIRDLTTATLEQFNEDLAYENQIRRTNEALTEYAETQVDAEATAADLAQAQADAAQQALAQAGAAVRANEDIAAMTDEVEKAAAENELLRIELEKVADTLDPSDPLRRQLMGYIAELESIPGARETVITTRYRAIQEAEAAATAFRSSTSFNQAIAGNIQLPAFASGSIVTRPTVGLIGEAGPEAIVPLNKAGALGNTFNITVTSADPNAVVDAIRKYNRISGPAPIKVA